MTTSTTTLQTREEAPLKVAVLGAGTVGGDVLRALVTRADALAHRAGAKLEVIGIYVRNTSKKRAAHIDTALYVEDPHALVKSADIVLELMGGIDPAKTLILEALEGGASVVTANKALLAEAGGELQAAAARHGVDLFYEAAVAGAVPIIRPLRECLEGDRVERVLGIVNGTTNFILDTMTREGGDFDTTLARAQELGYAEADPTADVAGLDAAAKAALLASLAFHTRLSLHDVHVEGIESITAEDIAAAGRLGRVIRLLSIVERIEDDGTERVSARVYPVMIPLSHPLAGVHGAFNAVFVEAEYAGELMFYGQGAGGAPTASAVLGDLVCAARGLASKSGGERLALGETANEKPLEAMSIDALENAFYLSLTTVDRPGVLARLAGALSESGISIATIHQDLALASSEEGGEGTAHIGIVTHRARESAMSEALDHLARLDDVKSVGALVRVEGEK
ncbi:homoserine dehydrogenase [Dermabacter sp. p3-SID358]|uniref:homoserine dehydrogenase n=1 Tax=Dermabacter sp. p3-SID358 TaxID=2916114 RepID=UPI0021A3C23A|nr:homoserine dehydrogenase [Dermabacter sp. p3-SID358]MCT1866463.1 homoserine dehydrogenase [Dermabacter sp. p3-SID358]